MTKEIENRFLILYSIMMQNGKASKRQVLDYLEDNHLILLDNKDKEILDSRNEPRWRNELAFVRQHLVQENYLDNRENNYWTITDKGQQYFQEIQTLVPQSNLLRISKFVKQNTSPFAERQIIRSQIARELLDDNWELENESQTKLIEAIKRYQKIVTSLKEKYKSKCQIVNCNFTFPKKDGTNYSEGHHLLPLSQGGGQNSNNVVILCANHHRMFHYAKITLGIKSGVEQPVILNDKEEIIRYIL